jgi:signal transduction histidine kinase
MSVSAMASPPRPRRRPRDWVVDTLLFLLAALVGLLSAAGRLEASTEVEPGVFAADLVAGTLGCIGLWWRRRWPVGLALVLVALSTFSEVVAGAMVVGLFTVAIHRPPRTTAAVYGLSVLAALVYVVVRPEPGVPRLWLFLFGVVVQGAAVGWGLFIHFRRQLVLSLRDRAARAETEARLRAEQAQQRARDEIAREMHDVLGHRLSLLSVHAGALEFRPGAPTEEIARAAKVIRENAHLALQDLREVIGVLRAPVGELPQPTLADVEQLVAESGRAGMRVDLRTETGGAVPDLAGRTAYRVVQEALTNARKHAPGTAVLVRLAGSPGEGLTVEVCNDAPGAMAAPARGAMAAPARGPGVPAPDPAGAPHPDPPLPGPPRAGPPPAGPPPTDASNPPGPAPGPPVPAGAAPHPPGPAPGPPVGERSPTASSGPGVVHSPGPGTPAPDPGAWVAPDPGTGAAPDPGAGAAPDPGTGQGLVGLAERVALVDGRLEHGPTAEGGWRVAAWLPWPP